MSRSFTHRPSVQTRGRGAYSRGRGRGTNNSIMHPAHRPNYSTNRLSSTTNPNNSMRPMDAYNHENDDQDPDVEGSSGDQNADRSRGEFRDAYTVFAPDQRRRQKVHEMAQRETAEYERYKQAAVPKTYHYVGTVGGRNSSEEEARRRQAEEVRLQKYNRLAKQQQYKEDQKKREEKDIEEKRAEARRKAEQNELSDQARVANPEDLRKKREQFLNRLQNNSFNN